MPLSPRTKLNPSGSKTVKQSIPRVQRALPQQLENLPSINPQGPNRKTDNGQGVEQATLNHGNCIWELVFLHSDLLARQRQRVANAKSKHVAEGYSESNCNQACMTQASCEQEGRERNGWKEDLRDSKLPWRFDQVLESFVEVFCLTSALI